MNKTLVTLVVTILLVIIILVAIIFYYTTTISRKSGNYQQQQKQKQQLYSSGRKKKRTSTTPRTSTPRTSDSESTTSTATVATTPLDRSISIDSEGSFSFNRSRKSSVDSDTSFPFNRSRRFSVGSDTSFPFNRSRRSSVGSDISITTTSRCTSVFSDSDFTDTDDENEHAKKIKLDTTASSLLDLLRHYRKFLQPKKKNQKLLKDIKALKYKDDISPDEFKDLFERIHRTIDNEAYQSNSFTNKKQHVRLNIEPRRIRQPVLNDDHYDIMIMMSQLRAEASWTDKVKSAVSFNRKCLISKLNLNPSSYGGLLETAIIDSFESMFRESTNDKGDARWHVDFSIIESMNKRKIIDKEEYTRLTSNPIHPKFSSKECLIEIKVSLISNSGTFNWINLRPSYNIDFYLLVAYDFWESYEGQSWFFLVPAQRLYDILERNFSGVSSGTIKSLASAVDEMKKIHKEKIKRVAAAEKEVERCIEFFLSLSEPAIEDIIKKDFSLLTTEMELEGIKRALQLRYNTLFYLLPKHITSRFYEKLKSISPIEERSERSFRMISSRYPIVDPELEDKEPEYSWNRKNYNTWKELQPYQFDEIYEYMCTPRCIEVPRGKYSHLITCEYENLDRLRHCLPEGAYHF